MSTTPTSPVVTSDAPALTQMERVVDTFFEPSKTMADIRRNTTWWLPFVLLAIFSYGLIFTWSARIGFEKLAENQISMNPKAAERMEKLSPEQRDQQMRISVAVTKGISYGYPIMLLISIALIAAIVLGLFNFGLGTQVKYGTSMAITAYSMLPGLISSVLAVVIVFFSDPDGYDMRKPVPSNPGAFVDSTAHPALFSFLSTFDVFILWMIFLLATGFAENSKVKRTKAFIAIFGLYFAFKLLMTGIAAI